MTMLAATFLLSAIVAGSEQPVAPVTYVPGGGSTPVIASAGPDSLVVWPDVLGIKAAAISATNTVSPIPSRRVHIGSGSYNLSMVWTGRAYLMTWGESGGVMAATLTRDGVLIAEHVIDPNGVTSAGALAWNGRHALLAGSSALLLDADGNVVKRNIAIADLPPFAVPSVVAVNDVFHVFWTKGMSRTTVLAARVSDAGVSLDVAGVIVAVTDPIIGVPAVAFDGRTLAMAFFTTRTLQRYLVDPRTLAATPLPDVNGHGFTANILWSGSAFVVYWSDYGSSSYHLETVSFTADEPATTNTVADGAGIATDVVAAATGSGIVMTWTDRARGGHDVMALALTPDGKARTSEKFFVAYGAQAEVLPAVAPGMAVWGNTLSSGLVELYASRIAADGTTIGAPLQLSTTGHVSPYRQPFVVFTGSIWFVAWNEVDGYSTSSVTRRIGLDGTLLDAKPVSLLNRTALSIAFNGSTILMPCTITTGDLIARRFDANGNPIDIITIAPTTYALSSSATSNGRDFLVAWTVGSDYWQSPSKDLVDVVGARVAANGIVIDTTPIGIAIGPDDQIEPHAASDGNDYLVAYVVAGNASRTMLQRVSRDGFVDGAPIAFGDASTVPRAMVGNASGYWIASTTEVAHLDASGAVTDHAAIAATDSAFAPVGDAAVLAYARFDSAAEVTRVFTRHLTTELLHGRAAGR